MSRGTVRLVVRRLVADPAVVITLLLAVALSTAVLASAPRLFERLENEALEDALSTPAPPQRNVEMQRFLFLSAGTPDDPFSRVRESGIRLVEQRVPDPILSIVAEQRWLLDSPQFVISEFPGEAGPRFDSRLRFRYQEGVEDEVVLSSGSLPRPRDPIPLLRGFECPDPGTDEAEAYLEEPDESLECEIVATPVHEVAMTAATVEALGADLGTRYVLAPDGTDTMYRRTAGSDRDFRLVVEISGIIELSEPDQPVWFGDDRLHTPPVAQNADFTTVFAHGLLAPDDYGMLVRNAQLVPWSHTYRLFVDPERVMADEVRELAAEIRGLEAEYPRFSAAINEVTLNTGLSRVLDAYAAERQSTVTLLSTALATLGVGAVLVVGLLSALIEARHRAGLVLTRNRGGSRPQLVRARLVQGLLLSVPAAGLGLLVATALVPDVSAALSVRISMALAVGAAGATVAASVPLIARDLGRLQDDPVTEGLQSQRRIVIETFVVLGAIGVVVILRRRGLEAAREVGSVDALLAVAPAVLGAAVGLLAVRLLMVPVRVSAWIAARRDGAVVFVGLRRVLRQVPAAQFAQIVVVLAVATAVFASVVRHSIDEGQIDSTWQEVGASFRLSGGSPATALAAAVDPTVVSGVTSTATGTRIPAARTDGEALVVPSVVDLLLLDVVSYESVVGGSPADPNASAALLPEAPVLGTPERPIPAIASRRWGDRAPVPGDVFSVDLGRISPVFVVVEVREQFPSMPLDRPFVIADRTTVEGLEADPVLLTTVLYVAADPEVETELLATIDAQSRAVRVASQGRLYDDRRQAPFTRGVNQALAAGFLLSGAFAVVGAVSTLVLTAAHRRRDLGYLRTMGLSTRQAVGMTALEHLPSMGMTTVVGVIVGVATALVFEPAIDLVPFAGPRIQEVTRISGPAVGLVGGGLLVAMAAAVGIVGWVSRREHLGALLRLGDE